MESIFIRRCINGKSFAASADPSMPGLEGKKCPFSGDGFEPPVKEVNVHNAEVMGINFKEAQDGVRKQGLYFGKFKINLGETMIM